MPQLCLDSEYEWEPFTVDGQHLTFAEHRTTRLIQDQCSHLDAAVYKWEGILTEGPYAWKTGILIGETADIRKRINQYLRGTQEGGNVYWRENFLDLGKVRLYILRLRRVRLWVGTAPPIDLNPEEFSSGNRRVVYEQLLVMQEVERGNPEIWIVNRKI